MLENVVAAKTGSDCYIGHTRTGIALHGNAALSSFNESFPGDQTAGLASLPGKRISCSASHVHMRRV